jgi:hypothetical protein
MICCRARGYLIYDHVEAHMHTPDKMIPTLIIAVKKKYKFPAAINATLFGLMSVRKGRKVGKLPRAN